MARYFMMICGNNGCASKEDKILGDSTSHKLVGSDGGEWIGACELCGMFNRRAAPEQIAKKQRYPYYNDSTGQTFDSRDDEKKFVKENNLIQTN